jgi:hypothetical protein
MAKKDKTGREHVQRHIKNDSEMKDGHGKMGTDFWIPLEKDEKFVGMTHVVSRSAKYPIFVTLNSTLNY